VHRWKRLLDEGRYAATAGTAAAERIDRSYLRRVMRLTPLAPDIVEYILDGRHPAELGPPRLMEPVPLGWDVQRTALAASA
jgi:hypothetical protein